MENTNGAFPMSEKDENNSNLIDTRPIISNQPEPQPKK